MCAALKVTRQGYYAWKGRPPSAHAMRDEELAELIDIIDHKDAKRMKVFLTKIRNHVKEDIEIKKS